MLEKIYKTYLFLPCSNNGAVARRAFENPEIMSRITGFPQDLIEDLYTLMCALNSTEEVDPDLYQELATSWINRFFSNPDLVWHWMNVTVHTVVYHGRVLMLGKRHALKIYDQFT